jgi:hypothetical protein
VAYWTKGVELPFGCKRLGALLGEGSVGNVDGDGDMTDPGRRNKSE